jgi:hypothetical protein
LSYSLARFGEAPPDIAFALEWLSQSLHLSFYTDKLKTETKNLIFQKILLKYKTLNNLNSDLDNQIDNYYLPRQIWFLQSKALDLLLVNVHTVAFSPNKITCSVSDTFRVHLFLGLNAARIPATVDKLNEYNLASLSHSDRAVLYHTKPRSFSFSVLSK